MSPQDIQIIKSAAQAFYFFYFTSLTGRFARGLEQ